MPIEDWRGFKYTREVAEHWCKEGIDTAIENLPGYIKLDPQIVQQIHNIYSSRLNLSLDRLDALVESPIEQQVGYPLFMVLFIAHPSFCEVPSGEDVKNGVPNVRYWLIPNYWVTPKIRVDFLITDATKPVSKRNGFVVECDSFQWHGNGEAFVKDKKREREILKTGYKVLRFSGSEINENPSKVMVEIKDFIDKFLHMPKTLERT